MISFDDVHQAIRNNLRTLGPSLIPGGTVKGNWYFVRVPWRDDSRASLGISLNANYWCDWGMPGDEGSLIDLVTRLDSCDAITAKNTLAGLLGLDPQAPSMPRPTRIKPRCDQCSHAWQRYPGIRYCTLATLDDEPRETRLVRRQGQECGPYGALFTPLASKS